MESRFAIRKLVEPGHTYGFNAFILIPFAVCPLSTAVKTANFIVDAFIPSFKVLVAARFVDTARGFFRTRAALVSQEGEYRRLYEAQQQWYRDAPAEAKA